MTPARPTKPGVILDVDGVTLQYCAGNVRVTATYRVGFQVHREDRFVLLGPSGCGKSTLLKSAAGFLKQTEGTITLNGVPVTRPGPNAMMVFQEFDQLLAWKTALQNVMFPMQKSGRFPRSEIAGRARRALDKVKLSDFVDAYPHTLSGGMKQRVAIARAMAMEPEILLMDEPFASLDALSRRSMQTELLELWHETKFTLLFVTHSIEEAIVLGNRILVLTPHPGRVRGELDCSHLDHASIGSPEFGILQRRIDDMLFGRRSGSLGLVAHG